MRSKKILTKAINNPNGFSFKDFETLLAQSGWTFDHCSGSHQIWYSLKKFRISIQPKKDGKAKGYQVKQFLEQYEKENKDKKNE